MTIGYHYLIHLDGTIEKGRPIEKQGAHCSGQNRNSIGICYVGGMTKDMKKAKDTRTKEQKDSLIYLMHELIYKYNKDMTIHGHNEFANKACPSHSTYKKSMRIYSLIFVLTLFSCSAKYHYNKAT